MKLGQIFSNEGNCIYLTIVGRPVSPWELPSLNAYYPSVCSEGKPAFFVLTVSFYKIFGKHIVISSM